MKSISVSRDIVPIAEFKTGLAKWFRNLQSTGRPLIITQHGRPAGILLSPDEYDALVYQKSFLDSVARGLADADAGNVHRTKEVKAALANRRKRE